MVVLFDRVEAAGQTYPHLSGEKGSLSSVSHTASQTSGWVSVL